MFVSVPLPLFQLLVCVKWRGESRRKAGRVNAPRPHQLMDGLWHLRSSSPRSPRTEPRRLRRRPGTTGARRDVSIWGEAYCVLNGVKWCEALAAVNFSVLRIHEHSLLPPTQRSSSYLTTLCWQVSLSLRSSFHLYSLHDDDTPAMLSWQQSGPDCWVARQLTSPMRGTRRFRAGDKQIT